MLKCRQLSSTRLYANNKLFFINAIIFLYLSTSISVNETDLVVFYEFINVDNTGMLIRLNVNDYIFGETHQYLS